MAIIFKWTSIQQMISVRALKEKSRMGEGIDKIYNQQSICPQNM